MLVVVLYGQRTVMFKNVVQLSRNRAKSTSVIYKERLEKLIVKLISDVDLVGSL